MQCECVLLGREAVGAVDAGGVAQLIRSLLGARERVTRAAGDRYGDRRRYVLRCRDGLEVTPCPRPTPATAPTPSPSPSPSPSSASSSSTTRPRRADDEGFESDDDTASTKSAASLDDSMSNASSCCFVDDHVFKFSGVAAGRPPASSSSSVATDSANSSGASDTDDVDGVSPTGQVAALAKSLTLLHRASTVPTVPSVPAVLSPTAPPQRPEGELYPLSDVAFCHRDPSFPRVVVWVVRRRTQRLSASPEGNSGLQALVFECSDERQLKKFCANFQEMSRRAKLDQYRHPHRRKDAAPAFATLHRGFLPPTREAAHHKPTPEMQIQAVENPKVVKLELEVVKGSDARAVGSARGSKSIPKSPLKPVPPPKPTVAAQEEDLPAAARFNLVQRTDGDGVTHIEVARGGPEAPARVQTLPEAATEPSSIISISTPDAGNLLTTGARPSRLGKEIEAVIRSDVDARREPARQRQPAILMANGHAVEELHKVWAPPEALAAAAEAEAEAEEEDDDQRDVVVAEAPQRPERRKFLRKKNPAPPPPLPQPPTLIPAPALITAPVILQSTPPDLLPQKPLVPHKPESLSRGQKIVRGQFIRVSVDAASPSTHPPPQPWLFAGPTLSPWEPSREPRRPLDDMFALQGHALRQLPPRTQQRRSRSTGRARSKSPPRRPMAYRYIDVASPPPPQPPPATAGRFLGRLRELSGGGQVHPGYATTRRRGSVGEQGCQPQGNHLKSVIKKSKRTGEYVEPKKVTFSAYATVQVVD